VVGGGGSVPAGPQVLAELVEGLGVLLEVLQVEHALRLWQVEALQVVVQPGAGGPEVRNPRAGGYASAAADDDAAHTTLLDVARHAREVEGVEQLLLLILLLGSPTTQGETV